MSVADTLRGLLRAPDPRTPREVDDEIAAELEFHLAEAARELEHEGLAPGEARRRAELRFGDLRTIRAACRRAQLGGRLMLVRIQWVVIAVLVFALAVLGLRSVAAQRALEAEARQAQLALQEAHASELQALEERLAAEREQASAVVFDERAVRERMKLLAGDVRLGEGTLGRLLYTLESRAPITVQFEHFKGEERVLDWFGKDPSDWRVGLAAAQRIVDESEPGEALDIARAIYPALSVAHREQFFKPFVFGGGHPHVLAVLDLGARDGAPSVRERAFQYLRDYALRDFSAEPAEYEAWSALWTARPLPEVFAASVGDAVARLRTLQGAELSREMRLLSSVDFSAARKQGGNISAALRTAGLPQLVEEWLDRAESERVVFALWAAEWLELDEAGFERHVARIEVRDWSALNSEAVLDAYCRVLGRPGNGWAVPRLLRAAEGSLGRTGAPAFAACSALAEIGDSAAIEPLIALLERNDTPEARYAIGYFGLRSLAGVSYDETHDAAWWREWWTQNHARFGR